MFSVMASTGLDSSNEGASSESQRGTLERSSETSVNGVVIEYELERADPIVMRDEENIQSRTYDGEVQEAAVCVSPTKQP